jgi:acetyl coenzyme A synthetase (ADP forming)-like protein
MSAPVPPRDPARLATDVVLRDGSTVQVRTATAADRQLVEDYLLALSEESRRLRFWTPSVDVSGHARKTVEVDGSIHVTLLALSGDVMVGGAQFFREGTSSRAEVSVSVADRLQGHGLGSILIGLLAQIGRDRGITDFHAEILPENHRMISVFRGSGFPVSIHARPGAVSVEFPTTITAETVEQYEEREHVADANAVRTFLQPRSVAVIGASRDPASIGGRLFRNLIMQPFTGVVYPVNPKAPVVQGVSAYPTIGEVPGDVDVAFVVVPAAFVNDVVRQCGEKGVRALVVISSGFGEVGAEGLHLQDELVRTCRAYGMRMIGPNCMGITNSDPAVRLNGTFSTAWAPEGRVAFMSQSGALGLAVMNQAASLGMGLSSFVSVGNKADVSANDLLAYWDDDDRTDVVLLYMESFGNPRRFARLARRLGERKPVVVVKSGRSAAGQRAASSHTGALLAASDTTVDAVFRQHGVIRTDTLEEMFDVATLLVNQPVPDGKRVAIVTNAGGLGIQCADMCEARGLEVPELTDTTVEQLRSFLPAEASVGNPVDMIASASHEDYGRAIGTVAADTNVDALIVIYIPPLEQDAPGIAKAMVDAIGSLPRRIPVLTCFMSSRGVPDVLRAPGVRIPSYGYPEQAAIALAHAAEHGAWRLAPHGEVRLYDGIDVDAAHGITAGALTRGDEWLTPDEVAHLLDCYGLPRVRERKVTTPEEAADAAAELGARVALKAVGPVHKTEVGAVALDLSPGDVAAAVTTMAERVAEHGQPLEGFVVQEMVPDGVEMLVGSATDAVFGPVVAVGAGGVTVELTRDVQVGVAPLTDLQAESMVRSLATFPLLDGFRGASAADVPALVDVVLRVSTMADAHPEIVEMDCNPVIVLDSGAVVVDARVRVRPPAPAPPFAPRAGD